MYCEVLNSSNESSGCACKCLRMERTSSRYSDASCFTLSALMLTADRFAEDQFKFQRHKGIISGRMVKFLFPSGNGDLEVRTTVGIFDHAPKTRNNVHFRTGTKILPFSRR